MSNKILVLALATGFAVSASASIISVNLTDGGGGDGNASAGNTAGAVLAGYWNTVSGPSGAGLNDTDINSLTDDSGALSGVTMTQSDNGLGGWYQAPSGFSGTVGNTVMENFADNTVPYTYTLGNVNAGVGATYDVYIYSARGFANTGVTQFDVNGETKFLANESIVGDYAESGWASQALAEANPDSGNYVRFQNVTLDTLVIGIDAHEDLTNGGFIGSVSAIQIVAIPEPATLGLIAMFGGGLLLVRRKLAL